mmetsp:Transcript_141522/g.452449  ORF Transcript_141522/g.452449 Transcript_141522/m.452449 type:complete len:359 (-) Transcript_141522:219-1295(-)
MQPLLHGSAQRSPGPMSANSTTNISVPTACSNRGSCSKQWISAWRCAGRSFRNFSGNPAVAASSAEAKVRSTPKLGSRPRGPSGRAAWLKPSDKISKPPVAVGLSNNAPCLRKVTPAAGQRCANLAARCTRSGRLPSTDRRWRSSTHPSQERQSKKSGWKDNLKSISASSKFSIAFLTRCSSPSSKQMAAYRPTPSMSVGHPACSQHSMPIRSRSSNAPAATSPSSHAGKSSVVNLDIGLARVPHGVLSSLPCDRRMALNSATASSCVGQSMRKALRNNFAAKLSNSSSASSHIELRSMLPRTPTNSFANWASGLAKMPRMRPRTRASRSPLSVSVSACAVSGALPSLTVARTSETTC